MSDAISVTDALVFAWARIIVAGIGAVFSGLVLYYIKRVADRKDAEDKRHASAHRRYESNFIRIDERHPEYRLDIER